MYIHTYRASTPPYQSLVCRQLTKTKEAKMASNQLLVILLRPKPHTIMQRAHTPHLIACPAAVTKGSTLNAGKRSVRACVCVRACTRIVIISPLMSSLPTNYVRTSEWSQLCLISLTSSEKQSRYARIPV